MPAVWPATGGCFYGVGEAVWHSNVHIAEVPEGLITDKLVLFNTAIFEPTSADFSKQAPLIGDIYLTYHLNPVKSSFAQTRVIPPKVYMSSDVD